MARCSREQRDRAVDLYVRYERCAADVIRELGYPSRGMLPVWYRERLEEERTGRQSTRGKRYRRYTDEQKREYLLVSRPLLLPKKADRAF